MTGVIKYLALFPQLNEPNTVTDDPSDFSEMDAVLKFKDLDKTTNPAYLMDWYQCKASYIYVSEDPAVVVDFISKKEVEQSLKKPVVAAVLTSIDL